MGVRVTAVVRWDWPCLGNVGTQVHSLARLSGIRILHCHSCGLGHDYSSDLIPGQEKKKKGNGHKPQYYLFSGLYDGGGDLVVENDLTPEEE